MTDVSRAAVRAVEALNKSAGKIIAAYTFDAGPNAVIYHLLEHARIVVGTFRALVGQAAGWGEEDPSNEVSDVGSMDGNTRSMLADGISRVIYTSVGEGPVKVDDHLVDEKGEPVHQNP